MNPARTAPVAIGGLFRIGDLTSLTSVILSQLGGRVVAGTGVGDSNGRVMIPGLGVN
jgi:hypothetical protein